MNDLDIIISGLTEYIEILVSMAHNNNLDDYIEKLDLLKEQVENCTTYNEFNALKDEVKEIDTKLNTEERKLTPREESLVQRGYDKDEILRLSSFTEEDIENKMKFIIDRITKGCSSVDTPICIYLGGQPGSGKSTASRRLRNNKNIDGLVDVSLDNYRSYHPNYLEIEDCIRRHWAGREETENDTMGNDIADFTHNFAGIMSDRILDYLRDHKYNIVLEWGMRSSKNPIERMKNMKENGYINIVDFILVHKDISREACRIRANVMNDFNHIIRRVPDYFHESCISTLPTSASEIYNVAYLQNKDVDQFMLTDRNNNIVWDQTHKEDLKQVFEDYLNNIELSKGLSLNDSSQAVKSYQEEGFGFNNELNDMLNEEEVLEEIDDSKIK